VEVSLIHLISSVVIVDRDCAVYIVGVSSANLTNFVVIVDKGCGLFEYVVFNELRCARIFFQSSWVLFISLYKCFYKPNDEASYGSENRLVSPENVYALS